MAAKNTYAQRAFKIGERWVAKAEDLSALPANQIRDFQRVGLLGEKPADEAPGAPGKA